MKPTLARTLSLTLALALTGCGSDGDSSSSSAGASTAVTTPGAPTIGAATAGNASASIAFTAPASNGGAAITSYAVTCTAGASVSATGSASPVNVTGLANGTTYSCSVTATNSAGAGAASGTVSVTPVSSSSSASTASVDCPYSGTYNGTYSSSGGLTASWSWSCNGARRTLAANGLPDHPVGTFPNAGNPNTISIQTVNATMTLTPTLGTTTRPIGGPGGVSVYARNGVKFDPGTAGSCPGTATQASNCNLAAGNDVWRIEALGQSAFNFGVDSNNAHVQPGGEYHYHGMPEGLLTNARVSDSNRRMLLVGWASDGYPVYARYCYSDANNASSALKLCTGSFVRDTTPDAGRPSTSLAPIGTFQSDWSYVAGSGDLDECNGRTGVTPEFPNGIYYYMATDSYPYMSRCLKGNVN